MGQYRRNLCILGLVLAIFISGCGITTKRFTLEPAPNSCQFTEVRRTLSTVARTDCWGEVRDGSPTYLGSVGGMGLPVIQGPIEALKAAATLGAGYFIYRAGAAIGNATIKHTGNVSGTVSGSTSHTLDVTTPTDFTLGVEGAIDHTGGDFDD